MNKIDRGVLVHDGTRRPDPEQILYDSLGPKDQRDMLLASHLMYEVVSKMPREGLTIDPNMIQQPH